MARFSILGKQVVSIPCEFIDHFMKGANPTFIAVYIYGYRQCFSQNPKCKVSEVAEALGILETDVVRAWQYWSSVGVCSLTYNSESDPTDFSVQFADLSGLTFEEEETSLPKEKPSYSLSEVVSSKEKDRALSEMYTHAEILLSKPLSQNDILTLYSLYDWLGLPVEVILMIVEHCVSIGKKSMRYIETVALSWNDLGITTPEKATEHLSAFEKAGKAKRRFKKLLGLSGRDFTQNEYDLLLKWSESLGFSDEMILLAYEKTIMQTGKVAFNYMNAILNDWFEKKIKTPEAANGESKKVAEPKLKAGKTNFSNYSQSGNYSDEDLEALLAKSSVSLKE